MAACRGKTPASVALDGTSVQVAGHQQLRPVLPACENLPRGPDSYETDRPSTYSHAVLWSTPDSRVAEESEI